MSHSSTDPLDLAQAIVARARAVGIDVAEAVVSTGKHLETKIRKGNPELLEEAGSQSLGVRVLLGKPGNYRAATAYSSDGSSAGIAQLIDDARELAELSEVDSFIGPPEDLPELGTLADLELFDRDVDAIDGEFAFARAKAAEAAAFAVDARVTNSEGASFSRSSGSRAIATTHGFSGLTHGTYASLSVHAVADDEGGKKRSGHHWTAKRFVAQMLDPKLIGEQAGKRAIAKLGSRKVPTGEVTVVFDPEIARGLVGLLASCVSGGAIWRKSSYLAGKLGQTVASSLVSIVDDPLIVRAPGSRTFDGEGFASRKNVLVEAGVLKTYLLDTYSARKLNAEDPTANYTSTASASRGGSGGVSVGTTNLFMLPGTSTPESIVQDTPRGLYVTDMMGFGFNALTGDFSRGAAGFWIENGVLTHPVSEVTLSLNIDDLWKRIDRVGNDLDLKTSVASPTLRVSSMMLAGG